MDVDIDRCERLLTEASDLAGRRLELVRRLGGGEHALTVLAEDDEGAEYAIRLFPVGDGAVGEEVRVLERLGGLGRLVPRLIAYDENADVGPIIVTSKVEGAHPAETLLPTVIAGQMAGALARIHQLDGGGLRVAPAAPPTGEGPAARVARMQWEQLDHGGRVLTHFDFWCGNALWDGDVLTGLVDWSGARHAPRGVDVAWCRQDLVLLGSRAAADTFLRTYERAARVAIDDIRAWDIQAAAAAEPVVETWAPNYAGIGRPDITGSVLRTRLNEWIDHLLDPRAG